MGILQPILVYITLAIAVGFLVRKFFLPKSLFVSKGAPKRKEKVCGQDDCGCH